MKFIRKLVIRQFRRDDDLRTAFYEDFADALEISVTPKDRLLRLQGRARGNKDTDMYLYDYLLQRLNHTSSFAKTLVGCVPDYELMVLIAAERDGKLVEAMRFLARNLRTARKIKGVYLTTMVSPIIGAIVALGGLVYIAKVLGPMNLKMMPLSRWPYSSRFLFEVASFFANNVILCSIIFAAAIFVVSWSKDNWVGVVRNRFDKIPLLPWKSHRERSADMFLMSLAMMVQTKSFSFKEALEGMRQIASPWMTWHINRMLIRFPKTPQNPASAMDTGLFSVEALGRIEDFATGPKFEAGLKKMAIDNSDRKIDFAGVKAIASAYSLMAFVILFILLVAFSQYEFVMAYENFVNRSRMR